MTRITRSESKEPRKAVEGNCSWAVEEVKTGRPKSRKKPNEG